MKKLARTIKPPMQANVKNLPFGELLSKNQRRAIDDRILLDYKSVLGYAVDNVPYKILYTAYKGGMHWYDLRADYNGFKRDYHVVIPNPYASPDMDEGFQTCHIADGFSRNEEYTAAVPSWQLLLRRLEEEAGRSGLWR